MNELNQFKITKSDFKLTDSKKVQIKNRFIKPPRMKEIPEKFLKYEYAEELANEIDIQKGDRFFVALNGTFIFGDFIEALIVEKNYMVKRLVVSTLSMSENNIDSLYNILHGGYVDQLDLIISDYFFTHERHNLIKYCYQELDHDDKFQLAVCASHWKTCAIETHCGLKIFMHGSANLRSSTNLEHVMIEENPALFDFNMSYQDELIETYKTIKKSIGKTKAWDIIEGNTRDDRAKFRPARKEMLKVRKEKRIKD